MYSVNSKIDLKTRHLTFKKVNYIMDEVTEDFKFKKLMNIEFHLALLYIFFLFYLRMWVHYVGQYITLQMMKVPITRFDPHWYKIYVDYAWWSFYQEVLVVSMGILSNSLLMLFMVALAIFFKKSCFNCFPRMFYKVICWYGIITFFDPFITLIIDLCCQVCILILISYRTGLWETILGFTITTFRIKVTAWSASTSQSS